MGHQGAIPFVLVMSEFYELVNFPVRGGKLTRAIRELGPV